MASFEQHVNGAVIGGGLLTVLLHSSTQITMEQSSIFLGLSILGGVLPDLDSDNSKPVDITFRILSIFLPLLFLLNLTSDFTIITFLIAWGLSTGLLYLAFKFLFLNLTVHRGIFHSIPMGVFFAQITILSLYYFVEVELYFATLCGLFLFIGFLIHLLLDELVSLNALGMSIKKSFGTALKLYDRNNKIGTIVLYGLILVQTYFIPKDFESYENLFKVFQSVKLY